jgi:uncharacterized membrane protein
MYDLYSPIMICPKCSAEMPEISSYCPACGDSVNPASNPFPAKAPIDRLLGAVAYVAIVPAMVLLLVPAGRSRPFVRFHAWQSVLLAVAACVLALALRMLFLVFSVLPFGGFLLAWLLVGVGGIAIAILWVALVVKATLGDRYELPLVGPWAVKLAR